MPYQAGSSAQRIRIGLTGLAFAFLLVLLGSIISRSSRDDVTNAAEQAAANEPSEPLAELGVAPGASDTTNNSSGEEMTARRGRVLVCHRPASRRRRWGWLSPSSHARRPSLRRPAPSRSCCF